LSEENWKKMTELLAEKLTPLEQKIQQLEQKKVPNGSGESHKHWKAEDILDNDCPDCKKNIDIVWKRQIKDHLKDADYKCVGCGLPVRKEDARPEEWKCPNCGENEALER